MSNIILWENDKFTLNSNIYVMESSEGAEAVESKVVFASQLSQNPRTNLPIFCQLIKQYDVNTFVFTGVLSEKIQKEMNTMLKNAYSLDKTVVFKKA